MGPWIQLRPVRDFKKPSKIKTTSRISGKPLSLDSGFLDVFGFVGVFDGHFAGDLASTDEADEGLVHGLAADGGAGGHSVGDLRGVARANQVADGIRDDHQLAGQGTSPVLLGNQLLGQDGLQAHGKLKADLRLHALGEDLNNTVDRVGGTAGVQGAKDKVAGLGRGDGGFDRVLVTHFTDQNDIRVFTMVRWTVRKKFTE